MSTSEDAALIKLINGYAAGLLRNCATLSPHQQEVVREFVSLFINQSVVDNLGLVAAEHRNTDNAVLLRNSWIYFGGLCGLFTAIATSAKMWKRDIRWSHLAGENVALITILGLYEWMFFRTVIFKYESVSMPELDSMVMDEFEAQC